jgi:hypothetical protein
MEDKLYSRAAYMPLLEDQKDALRQKCLNHSHVPTKKQCKSEKDNAGYHAQISPLTVRPNALKTAESEDDDAEATGNRSNKALTRQKK